MTKAINSEDFDTKVLGSDLPVLLKLGATWCGPCDIMNPIMDELSNDLAGKVEVVAVDVDDNPDIATDLDVLTVPMFVAFSNGQVKGSTAGVMSKKVLVEWFAETIR